MSRDLINRQKGQALVTIALAMVVLVGFLALAIDGGNAYAQRRLTQNAADAGALAGARALARGESIEAAVTEYAVNRNGADSAEVTVDGRTVTVVARKSFPSFLARAIGWSMLHAAGQATASCAPVGGMTHGAYPIAVEWEDFILGESYDLFAGGGPGNFGWLGWYGCIDAPCLSRSLTAPGNSESYVNPFDPNDHVLSIGDWVEGSTGVANAQSIRARLDALIAAGDPITVVVWDQSEAQGAGFNYRIAGFAGFVLQDYQLPGQNRITGRFVQRVIPYVGVTSGSGYGTYGMRLVE